ncbi:MAG TPA: SLBB domain-containing protein, partial [Chthonomonadaceae bacterium]|nr:SLBB domain-containing protein [Chthonomonadaceae bacterium]
KELETRITAELDKLYNNILVAVSVREIHSRQMRVLGAVHTVGTVDLGSSQWRLLDVIASVGGLAPRAGAFSAVPSDYTARLIREDKTTMLDIARAFETPNDPANITIQPGDLILFDVKEIVRKQVHVIGQVPRPGAYELNGNTNVLTLLDQAGMPLPTAALSKAYVLRRSPDNSQGPPSQISLDLRPVVEGRADETATKFQFKADDELYIPEVKTSYTVWGQVLHPGTFILPERGTVTVLDVMNIAGVGPTSDLKKVQIGRVVDGKQTLIPVDVKMMLDKGDRSHNVAIQPNDIVFVPPSHHKRGITLQDVFAPISLLSFLGFRFFN